MDELSPIKALNSGPHRPDRAATDRAFAALIRAVEQAEHGSNRHVPTRRRRRRMAWSVGIGTGAIALTAALVLTDLAGLAGLRPGASAEAAEFLDSAALDTVRTSDPVVAPGQYLAIRTTHLWSATTAAIDDPNSEVSWLERGVDELYIPYDQHGTWTWNRGDQKAVIFYGAEARRTASDRKSPDEADVVRARDGAFYGSPAQCTPASLAALSRDPRVLLNHIYRVTFGQGPSADQEALVWIADLLRGGFVPADLRATLYRAAAMIPGVTITDRQATLDGHVGVAIGRAQSGSYRQDIIIDPSTGLMIGERQVVLRAQGGFPAGAISTLTAITTTVADQVSTRPLS